MQCIGGLESFGRRRRSLRHKMMAASLNATSVKLVPEQGDVNAKRKNNSKSNHIIQAVFIL